MEQLHNFALGKWIAGSEEGDILLDASTGEAIASASSKGLDFGAMLDYGRKIGGPPLRKMTFQQRGQMLKALALYLNERKEKYYTISYKTGATKVDSWIDIDGGLGNLFANASLRKKFPNETYYLDGEIAPLSKAGSFIGQHIMVPKEGVAIHINAFNFPIWGMLEKIAVNLLAGVPAVVKPATITSYLTEAMVKDIIASGILPEGALQLIIGSARGILDHAESQDVITFTGSATTGRMLKANPRVIEESIPFNMEADSLNCSVLGPDAIPGTEEFDLFIKEVRKEMTVKCGQKCTAVRRIIVPENLIEDVQIALGKALGTTSVGDPRTEGVRMGALAGRVQLEEVRERVKLLSNHASIVYGNLDEVEIMSGNKDKGAFMSPLLLLQMDPFIHNEVHEIEAFGPVSTMMPYKKIEEAIELAKMGKGSLVTSIVTHDDQIARQYVLGAAAHHGRILVLNRHCAKESTGHGSPMPLLVHGGPGRAGGGEEMGGMRGVKHYMQRCAVQGSPTTLTAVTNVYQPNAAGKFDNIHPFRKYFEELEIGNQIITGKRTITDADIKAFANLSWDHFYAHTDHTSLDGTLFEHPVAHGYFIMSAAAGLFVENSAKCPVLLNYGLDDLRFTKPVYAGTTIYVRFTCKEKIEQEKRDENDVEKGIVKWYVEMFDDTDEHIGVATILTMVKKKEQAD